MQTQGSAASTARPAAYTIPSIALARIQPATASTSRSGPATPGTQPGSGKVKWIYTAQLYGNDLEIYHENGGTLTFFESLTTGVSQPQGTRATPNGWWYVANGGASDVLVYKTTKDGPVGPTETLDDSGQVPDDVDLAPDRLLVAVSNMQTTSGGSGSVSVYLDRQHEPARTLTYGSNPLQGIGVALYQNDCYWSFNDPMSGRGSIVAFASCNGAGSELVSGITKPGGLAFDQQGNLYYVDQAAGIYKCQKLARCSLFSTGFGDPVDINFDKKDHDLWVTDATGYIDEIDPKTGRIESTTAGVGGPSDPPIGIAPAPGG